MAYDINTVVNVALNEVGYLEKKSNASLDDKTANAGSNNYTKYWRDLNASGYQGQPWCNAFVNWVLTKSFGESVAKSLLCTSGGWSYYTPTSAGYFKAKGQWYTSNPKVGDIIYFQSSGTICHVGIVVAVNGSAITTVEGNTSSSGTNTIISNGGGVFKKSYVAGNSRIAGYGRPNYGTQSSSTSGSSSPASSTTSSGNAYIKTGQQAAIKFTGISVVNGSNFGIDGIRGPQVKKMAAMVLQTAINKDYGAGLVVDGEFGAKSKKALGSHYVAQGERQYMVTAAEILNYLLGRNPNGVEYPGTFGSGLAKAAGTTKITASIFLSYLN